MVAPYSYGVSFLSVINEGQRQLPGTGIITESSVDEAGNLQMPLLVLRDPPGDNSYSSIESGTTISKSLTIKDESQGSVGFYLDSKGSFAGVGFFVQLNVGAGGSNTSEQTFDFDITTSQKYSTSSSEDAVGRGADVVVGAGLSQQFGLARSLLFENENDCEPISETSLTFGMGGFESTYSYTIDFIEGLIDGYLRDSVRIESGALTYKRPDNSDYTKDEARKRVHALITSWKEMIHYHDVETVPHYVLCNDFSYREVLSIQAEAAYDGWRDGFCSLIGTYVGDEFVMDDQIEWTPSLISAYNNTVAFTNTIKDQLTFIEDGSLSVLQNGLASNDLSVTNEFHNLLGNQIKSAEVFDVSGNVGLERTVTTQQSSSTSKAFSRFFYLNFAGGFYTDSEAAVGVGWIQNLQEYEGKAGIAITAKSTISVNKSQAESNQSTISYNIFDNDAEDQVTFIALQAPLQDQTPYFIRLGGLSSCPVEEPLTVGQDNAPLEIDSFNMAVVIDPSDQSTTDTPPPLWYVDPNEAGLFEIKINNVGPTGLTRDAKISLDQVSNPYGAIVKIGGSNLNLVDPVFSIPAGGSITQFLTVERPPNTPFYDITGLKVGISPACGGDVQYIYLDVYFQSPCSNVSLTAPLTQYVVKRKNPSEPREVIPFAFKDFDADPTSALEYVQLQYRRLGNNSGWQSVPSTDARISRESLQAFVEGEQAGSDLPYFYEWDITDEYNLVPDGDYLVRAQSFCGLDGESFSNEVEIQVRRSPLLVTGYPEPSDGIWSPGDQISCTYSTDIDCGLYNVAQVDIYDYLSLVDMYDFSVVPFDYICQDGKMTIIPQVPSMDAYDGHTLVATYTGILDLAENVAETVEWSFVVVTQDVDWGEPMVEITLYEGETKTISTSLFNNTSSTVNGLEITGGSGLQWLSVTPSNGFSVPADGLLIDLAFDGNVAPGDYMTTLTLDNLGGTRVPEIPIILTVLPNPPFPDVAGDFTDSMELVLNWSFTDPYATSTDIGDAIYIYKDGQLRGEGQITVEGNFYHTKITVYGNVEDEGELIDFVIWNSNQQTAYAAQETSSIPFVAEANIGLTSDPLIILVDDDLFEIAKRIYVDFTNTGTQNGLSWNTAFRDLQDGIAVANDGDEIWIAEGTYRPTSDGDRSISYEVTNTITIYGGFVNGMDDIEDRTGANETILSGDLVIPSVSTDDSYHVMVTSSNNLLLDQLTISDGNANGLGIDDRGACLYNTGSITLKDCKMSGGEASAHGTLIYNNGQMILDGGLFTIPPVSAVSNLYNDTGALITIRENVEVKK